MRNDLSKNRLSPLMFAMSTLLLTTTAFASEPLKKVSNGSDASATQAPWQAAIVVIGNNAGNPSVPYHICDGSIIDKKWVMTAAHCFDQNNETINNLTDKQYYALVGEVDLAQIDSVTSKVQAIVSSRTIIHPQYIENGTTLEHDIALLELADPIDLTVCGTSCKVIPWATSSTASTLERVGRTAQIAGWGEDGNGFITPSILQFASVTIESCPSHPDYTTGMICAKGGTISQPIDTCSGDSGSALVANPSSSTPTIIGITSWGEDIPCGTYSNLPGAYTRVSQYSQWINSYVNPNSGTTENSGSSSGGGSTSGGALAALMLLALGRRLSRK